jgi:hypothetical protein
LGQKSLDDRFWPITSFRDRAGRFRGKADIERQEKPTELVENDPKPTSAESIGYHAAARRS